MSFFDIRAPQMSHPLLVFPVVVVRPIVTHDDQDRDLVLRRRPQGPCVVHEVAVWLEVEYQLVSATVGEAYTEGHPDLGRGA